jgi:hypothetical protein
MWVQTLLNEPGILQPHVALLWCDNLGATYLSANPVFHARTKHIDVRLSFCERKSSKKIVGHSLHLFQGSTDGWIHKTAISEEAYKFSTQSKPWSVKIVRGC